MLILNGFLRGLWVGIVAVFVWVVIAEMTGWTWMAHWNGVVFMASAVGAGLAKMSKP